MAYITIGFVIDELSVGGTEKQLIELISMLDRKEFNPILFVLRNPFECIYEEIRCEKYVLNIKSLKDLVSTPKWFRFIFLLKKRKVDIIQTFFPDSTLIGVLSSKIACVSNILITRRDIAFWHKRKTKIYYRIANLFADRWLVNSFAIKNYLIEKENINHKKIDIIHNGIVCKRFVNELKQQIITKKEDLTIGIISNFNRYVKRLDIYTKAMIMIQNKYENINFLVVGNIENKHWNMDLQEYEKRNFIFTGEVKNVREYLEKMDIGIIASDSEGFSNVILEYMASSIVCVCSNSGGNPEIIEDSVNGLLFKTGNPRSLYEKVSLLIENPSLRTEFAKNARQKVLSNFDWNKIIRKYESYYKSIII